MEPATEAMLAMAGIGRGSRVLDVACGAGDQTLRAASRVGPGGHVLAADIATAMLNHVQTSARAAGLTNVSTIEAVAEDLQVAERSFDAAICRFGLMLFASPRRALDSMRHALRPGGKVAVVVFTTPAANPFMARPMEILLRHAGKTPPDPGQPGIFALGASGHLASLLRESGFVDIEQRTVTTTMRLASADEALTMMRDAFAVYRAVIGDSPEHVQTAAWSEVLRMLRTLETPAHFAAPAEVLVTAAAKPG